MATPVINVSDIVKALIYDFGMDENELLQALKCFNLDEGSVGDELK